MSIPLLVAIPRRFNSYDREFQWGHNDGVAGDVTFFAGSGEKALLAYSVGYALGVLHSGRKRLRKWEIERIKKALMG